MDNKKWYKRISTLFWFLLATLPWWFAVFSSLVVYFSHLDSLATLQDINDFFSSHSFSNGFTSITSTLNNFTPSFLRSVFYNLFNQFGITFTTLSISCAWFCWVYFIELMVDFVVWMPRMVHSWMNRWCND